MINDHDTPDGPKNWGPDTLKRWLSSQPAADTLTDLQHQLDTFQQLYNHDRVHRAHSQTPAAAYNATL
jgi:hypothetical protein